MGAFPDHVGARSREHGGPGGDLRGVGREAFTGETVGPGPKGGWPQKCQAADDDICGGVNGSHRFLSPRNGRSTWALGPLTLCFRDVLPPYSKCETVSVQLQSPSVCPRGPARRLFRRGGLRYVAMRPDVPPHPPASAHVPRGPLESANVPSWPGLYVPPSGLLSPGAWLGKTCGGGEPRDCGRRKERAQWPNADLRLRCRGHGVLFRAVASGYAPGLFVR